MSLRFSAIITAAGSSQRFNLSSNSNLKKEFMALGSSSVLGCAIRPFLGIEGLVSVVVTYREGELEQTKKLLSDIDYDIAFVQGGQTRQESVFNALKFLYDSKADIEYVSIHDGARPFVTKDLIDSCLRTAMETGGSCPCIRVTDTLVSVDDNGLLCGRIPREGTCTVQTPQVFRFPEIYNAHLEAKAQKTYTDDTGIFMDAGGKVGFVHGDPNNRKITYASDLEEGK